MTRNTEQDAQNRRLVERDFEAFVNRRDLDAIVGGARQVLLK